MELGNLKEKLSLRAQRSDLTRKKVEIATSLRSSQLHKGMSNPDFSIKQLWDNTKC